MQGTTAAVVDGDAPASEQARSSPFGPLISSEPPERQREALSQVRATLPKPEDEREDAPLDGNRLFRSIVEQMPRDVQAGFAPDQMRALWDSTRRLRWGEHALDLRYSVPFFGRRYYLVLIGGVDRRSAERNAAERASRPPFLRAGNLLAIALLSSILALFVGVGIAL